MLRCKHGFIKIKPEHRRTACYVPYLCDRWLYEHAHLTDMKILDFMKSFLHHKTQNLTILGTANLRTKGVRGYWNRSSLIFGSRTTGKLFIVQTVIENTQISTGNYLHSLKTLKIRNSIRRVSEETVLETPPDWSLEPLECLPTGLAELAKPHQSSETATKSRMALAMGKVMAGSNSSEVTQRRSR